MSQISRRQFLQSAGGVTFLALSPVGRGLFAATGARKPLPIFSTLPYLQPGNNSRLQQGRESLVVAWQTLGEGDFTVAYGPSKALGKSAKVSSVRRWSGTGDGELRWNYLAHLDGLNLGNKVFYRVSCNGQVVLEGYGTTRQPRGQKIRFVSFGDNSYGDLSDHQIAFQAYKQNPDFVMNTGDNVYNGGLDDEYARYFFPVYNADIAGEHTGAPLLRSVPFYSVMANHDVSNKDEQKRPVADFDTNPDSLGYYTALHLPLNGFTSPYPTSVKAATDEGKQKLAHFREASGARFPMMANYSFDAGDAHFSCLDSNIYVDPTDKAVQDWLENDLASTDARWKFVVYHHPAFNVGAEHFSEQHMRVLHPIMEKHGVDFVLNGHEHSYQRARPFKFQPQSEDAAKNINSKKRLVPGTFTIDRNFDGQKNTRPQGIIHIVTGAGGKHLYDPEWNGNPEHWKWPEDGNVEYVEQFRSDVHSLSVFDLDAHRLTMRQVDQWGNEIDRIVVTKS